MSLSSAAPPATLHDALASARAALAASGIAPAEAAIDVDLYARTLLGWDRAQLLTALKDPVPEGLEPGLSEWTGRREQGEPSAYIVGHKEFWGLDLVVSPAVLIPRPESELIVEEALALFPAGSEIRAADVGTGSGCLALALAVERPGWRIVATDISNVALAVALENAGRLGVADQITFEETSFLDGVDGPFDLIVANPPYVRSVDRGGLGRGVRHEPEVALFGGASGLTGLTATLDAAATLLRPGGWLVMEFGLGQDEIVETLVAERPALRLDHLRHDLQDIPRTAVIQRTV